MHNIIYEVHIFYIIRKDWFNKKKIIKRYSFSLCCFHMVLRFERIHVTANWSAKMICWEHIACLITFNQFEIWSTLRICEHYTFQKLINSFVVAKHKMMGIFEWIIYVLYKQSCNLADWYGSHYTSTMLNFILFNGSYTIHYYACVYTIQSTYLYLIPDIP